VALAVSDVQAVGVQSALPLVVAAVAAAARAPCTQAPADAVAELLIWVEESVALVAQSASSQPEV
jgi:hypothetical protein